MGWKAKFITSPNTSHLPQMGVDLTNPQLIKRMPWFKSVCIPPSTESNDSEAIPPKLVTSEVKASARMSSKDYSTKYPGMGWLEDRECSARGPESNASLKLQALMKSTVRLLISKWKQQVVTAGLRTFNLLIVFAKHSTNLN